MADDDRPHSSPRRRGRARRRLSPGPGDLASLRALAPRRVLVAVALGIVALLFPAAIQLTSTRHQLLLAKRDLAAARRMAVGGDDPRAALEQATRRLSAARGGAARFPLALLRPVPVVGSPVRAAGEAAAAGLEAVAAGQAVADARRAFDPSGVPRGDAYDLSALHDGARRGDAALGLADRRLLAADASLRGPAGAWLPPVSKPARAIRAEVARGRQSIDAARRGLRLLAGLTDPTVDARLLLLSQDSLELRPTGGYIGSYGVLRFSGGAVEIETYAATEDLPAPVPSMEPPAGLADWLPSFWGLSNVNWWPDFPTTAATAREMFRRQGGGEVDGVVAITEHTIARLIGVLGPVRVPGYPAPVTEEGFDERVVYEVELKRPLDVPRKRFLIALATELFDRLARLPADRAPAVAQRLAHSIGAGDIQLWFAHEDRQRQLEGTVAAGELPDPSGDFLMLVDANVTASKANIGLVKELTYHVRRDGRGRFVGRIRGTVRNEAPESEINPYYNSLLRIYVPQGSQLLPGQEGHIGQGRATDGPYHVFSKNFEVQPREEHTLSVDYLLPDAVAGDGRYRLTWLRQAGTPRDGLHAVIADRRSAVPTTERALRVEHSFRGNRVADWLRRRWIVDKLIG